jgi:hypothetical protein
MNDIPIIKEYKFRMTGSDFTLDAEKHAVRFCIANSTPNKSEWLPGYCLFYLSQGGLCLYMFVGRGIEPSSTSLGIDNDFDDNSKLKIIGIDLI